VAGAGEGAIVLRMIVAALMGGSNSAKPAGLDQVDACLLALCVMQRPGTAIDLAARVFGISPGAAYEICQTCGSSCTRSSSVNPPGPPERRWTPPCRLHLP